MRIAVIGSGISGLASAYLLHPQAEVHLFERDTRVGGHSHTVEADFNGVKVPVDISELLGGSEAKNKAETFVRGARTIVTTGKDD